MLTKIPKTIQSSELRKNLARYLKASDKAPVFVSKERGNGSCVLIGSDIYNKLVGVYEEEMDEDEKKALIKGRRDFKNGNFLTIHEVRTKLGITSK
jgi:hypothetical protein